MALAEFLIQLRETGEVLVPAQLEEPRDDAAAVDLLRSFYEDDALEFPGRAPVFDPAAALWAANLLMACCQILVLREIDTETIEQRIDASRPGALPPVIHSVDLTLRYLPDLFTLAKGISPGDMFVVKLKEVGREWPLSSVGMPLGDEPVDIEPFVRHPGLARVYADRVIAKRDESRLTDERVVQLVREAIGIYDSIWPNFDEICTKLDKEGANEREPSSTT